MPARSSQPPASRHHRLHLAALAALAVLAGCDDDGARADVDVADTDAPDAQDVDADDTDVEPRDVCEMGCADADSTPPPPDADVVEVDGDTVDAPDADTADAPDGDDAGSSQPFYTRPWPVPERDWSRCEDTEFATPGTLAERAAYFQWLIPQVHRATGESPDGRPIVHALFHHAFLNGPVPPSIESDALMPGLVEFGSWGNAGLWTSLYLASQAFRYAVADREGDETERAAALAEIRVVLRAVENLSRITGKPGLFARSYHSPLPLIEHPEPGGDHHAITEGEFAGYTWTGDVSQDEYSAHMYALGVLAKLVDDADVQETTVRLLSEVGRHLMENDLHIIDVDGEVTEHGRMNALSLTHFPGYNAWLSLGWIQMSAQATGDPELQAFYDDCLLQRSGRVACIDHAPEQPAPYTSHFTSLSILQGCDTNFNSLSMTFLAAANLVWFEGDDDLRATYQRTFRERLMTGDPDGRDPVEQANPMYNFIYAAFGDHDAEGAPDVERIVRDAVCTLREFEPTGAHRVTDTTYEPEVCVSEQHGSLAAEPFPWRERDADIFKFWFGPYERRATGSNPTRVEPPGDFLLPYWMGRYFGFISADM